MLTQIYTESLLVDEDLADQVWGLWDAGEIDGLFACLTWWLVANHAGIVDDTGCYITIWHNERAK